MRDCIKGSQLLQRLTDAIFSSPNPKLPTSSLSFHKETFNAKTKANLKLYGEEEAHFLCFFSTPVTTSHDLSWEWILI